MDVESNHPVEEAVPGANRNHLPDGLVNCDGDTRASSTSYLPSSESPDPFTVSLPNPHVEQMTRWLRLFIDDEQVVELRALDVVTFAYRKPCTVSGFFDSRNLEKMAWHALDLSQNAKGVYFTLNPLHRDLLSRRYNRIDAAPIDMASDKDVLRYRWLLIDVDPQRISGVSATDAEKAKALETIHKIRRYLQAHNWPDAILADSGNGYHLLYRIDLQTHDCDLVKRVLHALGNLFDDDCVKVDRAVYNPSRITKFYGTVARKGDNSPERPHRETRIIQSPVMLQVVPRSLLEELAVPVSSISDKATKSTGTEPVRDLGTVQERVRAYLEKLPPAISGDHGHDRTFHAACTLILGFSLSVEKAFPLLQHYNQRCQPPWQDEELLHKLEDADKKEGPRGYLLQSSPERDEMPGSCFHANIMDSHTLQQTVRKLQWLVKQILVAGQPAVIGGPKKALKTSLVVDLALSLGSGRSYLNRFAIPQAVKVLVLSGESGQAAILDTAQRVCKAKGISLSSCSVDWCFELPRLNSALDRAALTTTLVAGSYAVVMIDPLYLCLLHGNAEGRQASNVFDIGPLLLDVARSCLDAGTTPVLVHHARKQNQTQKNKIGEPLELEDLAFSGVGEFARQWLLVSRREPFDPERGEHKLWLSVGGSAGHAGLYGLDVQEGIMDDSFGCRQWQVKVESAGKAIQAGNQLKEDKKKQIKAAKEVEEKESVLSVLRLSKVGKTAPDIAEVTGLSEDKTRKILRQQLQELIVVQTWVVKGFGTAKKPQLGWLLWQPRGRSLTDEQLHQLRNGAPIEDVLPEESIKGPDSNSLPGAEG